MTLQPALPAWEQNLIYLSQKDSCYNPYMLHSGVMQHRELVLSKAVAICDEITSTHSRSFYLASSLLPREKRSAMRVLYAFCRTADNLADSEVDRPADRLRELRKGITGQAGPGNDPVLTAWAEVRARYQIPLCYAEQLLDGVERDLEQVRYHTFEDLSVYCYGVASTVGLMSMHIIGFTGNQAIPYAIKLGVALQLTNILRDVGEDWRNGRLYLPLEELAAFGLDENDIAEGKVYVRWRNFMRFQIARARSLYSEAMPGVALLNPDGRFAVAAAAILYQGILDDIEAHNYDVFGRRAFVSSGRKLALLPGAYLYANKIKLDLSSVMEK